MRIRLRNGLPYVSLQLFYREQSATFENVLLDTGSASTVLSVDKALEAGIQYESEDQIHQIRGVGGTEFVFAKSVGQLVVENLSVRDFEVEFGAVAYGFEIDGVLGVDFLTRVEAVIDLGRMEIYSKRE